MKKQNARLCCWVGFLLPVCSALAQGTFQNLNFESAQVAGYSPGASIPISAGLPGWAAGVTGTNKTATIIYDYISLGAGFISICDTGASTFYLTFTPIEGKFSVDLFSQGLASPFSTSISQTGLVPSGTMSLQAKMDVQGPTPVVMLGGQVINMIPLAVFPTYTLYGGDISAFGGQTVTLSFTEPPPTQSSPGSLLLDSIVFSPQPVPEPAALGFYALGTLLIGWRLLPRRL